VARLDVDQRDAPDLAPASGAQREATRLGGAPARWSSVAAPNRGASPAGHARLAGDIEAALSRALRAHAGLPHRRIAELVGFDAGSVVAWCKVPTPTRAPGGSWRDHAACAGVPTSAFFDRDDLLAAVVTLCDRCPVQPDCLAHGIDTGSSGMFGGKVLRG
jgi:hypothetical protein